MAGSLARFTFWDILGVSKAIEEAKAISVQAAKTKSTVLITGETGTGKELFAQAIHNQSERRDRPFVAINCGAIPRELLESELFGYAEGAFTGALKSGRPGKFELANGGTVFLDEIGDMPSDMQVKLLRVLQSGEISRIGDHKPLSLDVRIIAATHVDLKNEIKCGNFREDLFYRLNVIPLRIPPLRERGDDIILLAQQILSRCRQSLGKPSIILTKEAETTLLNYRWPGNVRELENIIERAVNLTDRNHIGHDDLNLSNSNIDIDFKNAGDRSLLEHAERQVIDVVMKKKSFNVAKAAKLLGISRPTLYKKIKKYKISSGQ
jgi:transcriptional regulator with PAS, ATPase and Fis domain